MGKKDYIYYLTASIIGLVGAAFFLSPNITGNAISNMSNSTAESLGFILAAIGLVGVFTLVKRKLKFEDE